MQHSIRVRAITIGLSSAAIILAAACGDSTAPSDPFVVRVNASVVTGPSLDGDSIVKCDVDIRAVAQGKGSATWEGATFKYFAGTDRSAPFDSVVIPARVITEAFSGPIGAGAAQLSRWIFGAIAPFSVSGDVRYRPNSGGVETATFSFDCGPRVTTGLAAPTIDGVSVDAAKPDLEPGGTLTVRYTAASIAGIAAWGIG